MSTPPLPRPPEDRVVMGEEPERLRALLVRGLSTLAAADAWDVLKAYDDALAGVERLAGERDAAQREADIQLGEKLAAQITLKAVTDVLDLPLANLGNGWTEATPKILARIETIVDEAERGFTERDEAEAECERLAEERDAIRDDHEATWTRLMERRAECERLAGRVAALERTLQETLDTVEGAFSPVAKWRAVKSARAALDVGGSE